MLEDLAWEVFRLTGGIDEYLLYKGAQMPEAAESRKAENVEAENVENEKGTQIWN